jgi:hypothetical protein
MPPKASAKVPPKAPAPSKAPAKAANYTGLKIAFFPTSFFKNKKTLLKEIFYQSCDIVGLQDEIEDIDYVGICYNYDSIDKKNNYYASIGIQFEKIPDKEPKTKWVTNNSINNYDFLLHTICTGKKDPKSKNRSYKGLGSLLYFYFIEKIIEWMKEKNKKIIISYLFRASIDDDIEDNAVLESLKRFGYTEMPQRVMQLNKSVNELQNILNKYINDVKNTELIKIIPKQFIDNSNDLEKIFNKKSLEKNKIFDNPLKAPVKAPSPASSPTAKSPAKAPSAQKTSKPSSVPSEQRDQRGPNTHKDKYGREYKGKELEIVKLPPLVNHKQTLRCLLNDGNCSCMYNWSRKNANGNTKDVPCNFKNYNVNIDLESLENIINAEGKQLNLDNNKIIKKFYNNIFLKKNDKNRRALCYKHIKKLLRIDMKKDSETNSFKITNLKARKENDIICLLHSNKNTQKNTFFPELSSNDQYKININLCFKDIGDYFKLGDDNNNNCSVAVFDNSLLIKANKDINVGEEFLLVPSISREFVRDNYSQKISRQFAFAKK